MHDHPAVSKIMGALIMEPPNWSGYPVQRWAEPVDLTFHALET
jgi:hypothetical protein